MSQRKTGNRGEDAARPEFRERERLPSACIREIRGCASITLTPRGCVASCHPDASANHKPEGVAAQPLPEATALCGFCGSIPATHESLNLDGIIGGVVLCGYKADLTGTTVFDVAVERF